LGECLSRIKRRGDRFIPMKNRRSIATNYQTENEAFTPEIAEHCAGIYSELSQAGALIPQMILHSGDLQVDRLWCSCRAE
jgi:hypothetical protein